MKTKEDTRIKSEGTEQLIRRGTIRALPLEGNLLYQKNEGNRINLIRNLNTVV